MSSIDMDNGAVDETSHNTEICDGVVITATKITCMKMNLREDGNDFDAANSQDTSDEKDDADQERILCDGDRVDIDIDNKNETLNGIMMNCSITEMKDLPVGKDECSSMRNGQKDEENDKNLSDNDEEQEKENNNQRLLTDAAAQLGAMKDITMETDSYECHQEKKEEVCNDENKCDVINSPIFGEEITNELPNKDDDVIPDGCVTPDSESIIDFDENIAIVTEEKTKKPTLAAVVKDETGKGKLVYQVLGDASRFSYACVCAVSLGHLFETEYDRQWRKSTMKSVLVHLKLPENVESTMDALMDGLGTESLHAFIDTLRLEPVLKKNPMLLPEDLVTLALGSGEYDARMRVLIFHVAWHLTVKWRHLERFEEVLVKMLKEQEEETEEQKKERATNQKKKKRKRYALIGLATVGGGALIGLTAGLAAPLIAAGVGAVIGTSAAAALTTTAGIAIMTSLFGAAGAGLTGYKMKRRVGAIEQFEFAPLSQGNNLHVAIAISGWLSDEQPDNFHAPWINLAISNEQYYLRWESKYLLDLGRALEYLLNGLVTAATQEALKYTVLSGLLAALMWPATLLSVASVIDNPWGVAMQRSTEVGHQLADVIMSKQQGHRPVTLIGFSLGAKVIYNCLEEMLKRKGCEGLIQDVVLLGAPVPANPKNWKLFERIVAGRIINGFCGGDWLLRFLYRTASAQMSIAGLQAIAWENRRMVNVDLSDVVDGHLDYSKKMDIILRIIGVSLNDNPTMKLSGEGEKKKKPDDETDKDGEKGLILEAAGVCMDENVDVDDVEIAEDALGEEIGDVELEEVGATGVDNQSNRV